MGLLVKSTFSDFCIYKIFILAVFLHHISEIAGYYQNGQVRQEDNQESHHGIAGHRNYQNGQPQQGDNQETYHGPQPKHGPFWDDFRVTWGKNTSYPHFNRLPRTTAEAEKHGWYRTSKDCNNDGHFFGFRYAEPGGHSSALSLLFDIQGIICGIQMSVPLDCAKAMGNPYQFEQVPMFLRTLIKDKKHFTLSAYFVPPQMICTNGRTEEDLYDAGTGTGLWFQNGRRTLGIPLTLDEASYFGWNKVQCIPQMGYHSVYRLDLWDRIDCSRIWPFALLANKYDQIIGFIFMVIGDCHSKRFEHMQLDSVVKLLNGDDCPKCAVEQLGRHNLTTMHVYFHDPMTIQC